DNPVGSFFSGLGTKAHDVEQGAAKWMSGAADSPVGQELATWANPVDWAAHHGEDASEVFGHARGAVQALTGAWDGLHNAFAHQDAKAWLADQWEKENAWDHEHSRALQDVSVGGFRPFKGESYNPFHTPEDELISHPTDPHIDPRTAVDPQVLLNDIALS